MKPDKIVRGSSLGCNDVLHYMKQINTRSGSESREENLHHLHISPALPLKQTVSANTYLQKQGKRSLSKLLVSQRCLYALSPSFKDLQQCVVALIREVALASVTHRFGFCDHLVVGMFGLWLSVRNLVEKHRASKGPPPRRHHRRVASLGLNKSRSLK